MQKKSRLTFLAGALEKTYMAAARLTPNARNDSNAKAFTAAHFSPTRKGGLVSPAVAILQQATSLPPRATEGGSYRFSLPTIRLPAMMGTSTAAEYGGA